MNKADLLVIQAAFISRLESMSEFLCVATDSILAVNHKLTEKEKAGFHYCIEALRSNARGVIDTDRMIQEMEAVNS